MSHPGARVAAHAASMKVPRRSSSAELSAQATQHSSSGRVDVHAMITREQAETLLRRDGTVGVYLVRKQSCLRGISLFAVQRRTYLVGLL